MKESPHEPLTDEADKCGNKNWRTLAVAAFIVFQMIFMVVNESERIRISEEFQRMEKENALEQIRMENYILTVSAKQNGLEYEHQNHKHHFSTGRVKQGTAK